MTYRFGDFELDAAKGELRKAGRRVALQPKPLALLILLVAERHRVVPTDELLDALWPGETVTPSSLARAVSVARAAIDDTGRGARLRSYTRRGYRFVDRVAELPAGSDSPDAGASDVDASGIPLIGRALPLATLSAAWDRAVRGQGGVVLISGRAGIGKTRLADSFARRVERDEGTVLRGRALEADGEPPFWVWAQVLRALHRVDPERLEEPGLADSGELAALLPELRQKTASVAANLPEKQRRFVFFDAVARTLQAASQHRPVLVVFEDLHWADPASLRLLEHIAFDIATSSLLLVVTAREEAESTAEASHALAALRRQDHFESVALEGLSATELTEWVRQWTGKPSQDLAERLYERTGGVPLFVREAVRRIDGERALSDPGNLGEDLPAVEIDWVKEAFAQLSKECGVCLGAASVVGREFSLPLLSDICATARGDVLDVLDEAIDRGLIQNDSSSPTDYRFAHDLFREAAYEALTPGARARWHQGVALVLERRHAGEIERVVSELAFHRYRALALGDAESCFRYATRAAELAVESRAYEQAVRHWTWALEALEQLEEGDPNRRLRSLLGLGDAVRLAGDRESRREILGEAMVLARKLDRNVEFATAALGLCDLTEWAVRDDVARDALLEAAERIDPSDTELKARILTRLGYLNSISNRPAAEEHLRTAVAIARDLGASDPLEEALYALHLMLGGPDDKPERVSILEELRGAATAARDPVASVIAVLDVACDSLEVGDRAKADALRREADETAGKPAHPLTLWHRQVYDTGLALMEGRFSEVKERASVARKLGQRMQHPYALACYAGQLSQLGVECGAADDVLALLEPVLDPRDGPGHWVKARVARMRFAVGREEEARSLFRDVFDEGFEQIPRNLRWITTMVELVHCAADLEDAEAALALRELIQPFETHHSVLPMVICYGGPVTWALGRISELNADPDEALRYYRDALRSSIQLRARPSEAAVHLSIGHLLKRRGPPAEAREHLEIGGALAGDLGMRSVAAAASDALRGLA